MCTLDFKPYFNSKLFSDIKIKFNSGGCLHAHRIVLRQGSPVINSMLAHDMREARTGIIKFPGVCVKQ